MKINPKIRMLMPWICFAIAIAYGHLQAVRIKSNIIHLHYDLDHRTEWIKEVTKYLKQENPEKYDLPESKLVWQQFFQANPNLVIPKQFFPFVSHSSKRIEVPTLKTTEH